MLSMEEKVRVLKLLAEISEMDSQSVQKVTNGPDVSNRSRDEQGRFLPNESLPKGKEELPLRSIRLVKVKGTYGTYLVKDWESTWRAIGAISVISIIAILAMIFLKNS